MKKTRILSILLALACVLAVWPGFAAASSQDIVVTPVLPENQRRGVSGYFNLKVAPGQRQELAILVENKSQESATLYVKTVNPSTAQDGLIDYGADGLADPSRLCSFSQIASTSIRHLTLPPGGSQEVIVALKVPAQPFEGWILGSILLTREQSSEQSPGGPAATVAVLLFQEEEAPPLNLELGTLSRQIDGGKITLTAPIHNTAPTLATGVQVSAQVLEAATGKTLARQAFPDVELAPNAIFSMPIPLPGGEEPEGGYLVLVEALHQGQTWQMEGALAQLAGATLPQEALPQEAPKPRSRLPLAAKIALAQTVLAAAGLLAGLLIRRHREEEAYVLEMQKKIQEQLDRQNKP